jgi:hypothetical protein
MNNDYLWDRTGTDPEIEGLEAQLEGLRFRPADPPTVPARAIVLEPARPNWLLRLGLGFATASAACAALIFALFTTGEAPAPVAAVVVEEAPPAITKTEVRPTPPPEVNYVKASSAAPPQKPKPKKRIKREAKFTPAPVEPRPLPETFTAEERDAYRQLMTALAVTSENLNIVREKLNGTDKD